MQISTACHLEQFLRSFWCFRTPEEAYCTNIASWYDESTEELSASNIASILAAGEEKGDVPLIQKRPSSTVKKSNVRIVKFHKVSPGEEDAFHFEKERVEKEPSSKKSTMTSLFDQLEERKHRSDAARRVRGPKVTVYLPSQKKLMLPLSSAHSISEVIEEACAAYFEELKKAKATPKDLTTVPEHYEMRLHDEDGLPDMDFPALDRTRLATDVGTKEMVLCPIPPKYRKEVVETASASSVALGDVSSCPVIKILMPNNSRTPYSVIPLKSKSMTAGQVLDILQRRHGLDTFRHVFVLVLEEKDRRRLGFQSVELKPSETVAPLGVRTLTVRLRRFADMPERKGPQQQELPVIGVAPPQRPKSPTSAALPPSSSFASNPSDYTFNVMTAAEYQEWDVIKINKRGKRQRRLLGIDFSKVYNRRHDGVMTMKPEHKISDILSIEWTSQKPAYFVLTFAEGKGKVEVIPFETRSASEAALIVAKLRHLVGIEDRRRDRADRLRR